MPREYIDTTADPDCQQLLADVRALAERSEALSRRLDGAHVACGTLWGVTGALRAAVDAAEMACAPRDENGDVIR